MKTSAARADWNPYLAGIALGLVLLATYVLMGFGLGSSSAVTRLAYAAAHGVAPAAIEHNAYMAPYVASNPFEDWMIFEVVGVLLGGIFAAYAGGRLMKRPKLLRGPRSSVALPIQRTPWVRKQVAGSGSTTWRRRTVSTWLGSIVLLHLKQTL